MSQHPAESDRHLAALDACLGRTGLQYSSLPRAGLGGGFALAFAPDLIVALAVGDYLGPLFSISYGVAKDLPRDRARILDLCNRHNQNMTAYPVHLHDAEIGWDILLTLTYPIALFENEPGFVTGWALNAGHATTVASVRESLVEAEVSFRPYEWNADDAQRLLTRTLI